MLEEWSMSVRFGMDGERSESNSANKRENSLTTSIRSWKYVASPPDKWLQLPHRVQRVLTTRFGYAQNEFCSASGLQSGTGN